MTLRSILIALVLALLVWALAYYVLVLPVPGGKLGTLLFALLGALVGLIILSLVRKFGPAFIGAIPEILAVTIGSFVVVLAVAQFFGPGGDVPWHVQATIDCDLRTVDKDPIVVRLDGTVRWDVLGRSKDANVRIHDFKDEEDGTPKRPIAKDVLNTKLTKAQPGGKWKGEIFRQRVTALGEYKYSFTCGSDPTVDPTFYVPK